MTYSKLLRTFCCFVSNEYHILNKCKKFNNRVFVVAIVSVFIYTFKWYSFKPFFSSIKCVISSLYTILWKRIKLLYPLGWFQKKTQRAFLNNITLFYRLIFHSFFQKECLTIGLLILCLITRTFLSIWIATIHGSVVRTLVERNQKSFLFRLILLLCYSFPAAIINSCIEWLHSLLALQLREEITKKAMKLYLSNTVPYQLTQINLKMFHPEHRLTKDIELWAKHFSSLFITLTKPLLDILFLSQVLIRSVGVFGPLYIVSWYIFSGMIIRCISPNISELTTTERQLEAEYLYCHTSVVNHAEEIAFLRGNESEFASIMASFQRITGHLRYMMIRRFIVAICDSLLVKYGAFIIGYGIVSLPIFGTQSINYKILSEDKRSSQITQDYVQNASLLINLAKAIGRLVSSQHYIQAYTGYSILLCELFDSLETLSCHKDKSVCIISKDKKLHHVLPKGKIIPSLHIEFRNASIYTPTGHLLVDHVNFCIQKGQQLFIMGPNGSGKSSLFRILGGLWPLITGELYKPFGKGIFYVPQRPYLPCGTLRDQLIYPDLYDDFLKKTGIYGDELIENLLNSVGMGYLLVRYHEEKCNTWRHWNEELSGGEKQRIAIARLCYHRPLFAILDEATNAVSSDVEERLYQLCQAKGMTLITVSHRLSLLKYHNVVLKFDGKGYTTFEKVKKSHIYTVLSPTTYLKQDEGYFEQLNDVVTKRSASQQCLSLQQQSYPSSELRKVSSFQDKKLKDRHYPLPARDILSTIHDYDTHSHLATSKSYQCSLRESDINK